MGAIPISAVVICRNAEETISACCASLQALDEVLIYLNGSTDQTRQRCQAFDNVTVVDGEFLGFGPTKNAAVSAARHDWVLSLDSDEFADDALIAALRDQSWDDANVAFTVLRKNRFCGQHVDKGGWGNDTLLRVFHRATARFNERPVHEKVVADSQVNIQRLDGVLWHDAVTSLDQFLQKTSYYSELNAQNVPPKFGQHPMIALFRAFFRFFKSYVLQLGFLAGWRGIVIAYASGTGAFFKYAKRYTKSRGFES